MNLRDWKNAKEKKSKSDQHGTMPKKWSKIDFYMVAFLNKSKGINPNVYKSKRMQYKMKNYKLET